ncbi:MAG: hypothetical protein WDN30_12970 [Pararobbsia sp.]
MPVTDIEVELVEHKQGRKVVDLQFRIRLNEQPALDLPAPPLIDAAMIERLMQLGIAQEEATRDFRFPRRRDAARDARPRRGTREKHQGARARFARAYFKSALRNRYASPRDVARKTLATTAISATADEVIPAVERGPTLRERYAAKRSREATDYFNEIEPQQRDQLLLEYEPEAPRLIAAALRRSGLHSKVAQTGFFGWLANRLWGEASDKDLLAFCGERALGGAP